VCFCIILVDGITLTKRWEIDTHAIHQFDMDRVKGECGESPVGLGSGVGLVVGGVLGGGLIVGGVVDGVVGALDC
jgi:hypothetical protein